MERDWLYNEYVIKDKSSQAIADEFGCKQGTIQWWLLHHGIKKDLTPKYHCYDFLYTEYIVKHKTRAQIAQENGVSLATISNQLRANKIAIWDNVHKVRGKFSKAEEQDIIYRYTELQESTPQIATVYHTTPRPILNCLQRNGIPRRTLSEAQFVAQGKPIPSALTDKELLEEWHWQEYLSCADIGARLGCDPGTVRRYMHMLGLKTRNNAESKIGQMVGDKHPNWQGGITPLHLLLREFFHINLAPIAAQRDNYTCCECGQQHTVLHVHHIYPFAQIMQDIYHQFPDLDPLDDADKATLYEIAIHDPKFLDINNLQTLCVNCHRQKHSKIISSQADQ